MIKGTINMSEIRQRHKDKENEKNRANTIGRYDHLYLGGCAAEDGKDALELEDIIRMSYLTKHKVVMPSNSNATQDVKDALVKDPYNMDLIKKLGDRYAGEFQYDKCANVMIRGWKRVSEFKDANDRFNFLMKLTEATYRNFQFRQAHAILMDVEPPEDPVELRAYQLLSCHVASQMGDAPKALSVFSKAIEKDDFEAAIRFWAASAIALKKVGAFEAAKNAVMNKVRSGPNHHMDSSRCQTVESWACMSSEDTEEKKSGMAIFWDFDKGTATKELFKAVAVVFVVLFLLMLYTLEQNSLRNKKITL